MSTRAKRIFYFDDEPEDLRDYIEILRAEYEVIVGASRDLVEQPRRQPIELVIVDLMIYHFSFEGRNEVQNISYPGISWKRTGVEFLRRLRAGNYERFGFPAAVPVIVATVRVDSSIREEVEELNVEAYLEKPFTIDELEETVNAVFINYVA
jgi:CheY-like chemotaxis protein